MTKSDHRFRAPVLRKGYRKERVRSVSSSISKRIELRIKLKASTEKREKESEINVFIWTLHTSRAIKYTSAKDNLNYFFFFFLVGYVEERPW